MPVSPLPCVSDGRMPASPRLTNRPMGPQQCNNSELMTRQEVDHAIGRCRWCFKHQLVTIKLDVDTGGMRRLEGLNRVHSRALQRPAVLVFSCADWEG